MTTPTAYRFQDRHRYPIDNVTDFEFWLTQNPPEVEGWTYLPITWTAYYKMCKYGADKVGMKFLQDYLNGLDRSKRYVVCCQWDDGVLHDLSHLNVRYYNMGSPGDYQLPLICEPHQYQFGPTKDIFCSFVGRVTHPIRQRIVDELSGKEGYYISTKAHKLQDFCEILARSRYVLAPRGYGMTSFRICEALQYGAVPIYISDTFLHPHGLKEYPYIAYTVDQLLFGAEIDMIEILRVAQIGPGHAENLYHQYFTYEANKKLIIEDLKKQL